MVFCKICRKAINKNDIVSVLSYPVRIIDNNGEYSFSDFLQNEYIIHFNCLDLNTKFSPMSNLESTFRSILSGLGQSFSGEEIERFIMINQDCTNIEKLVRRWLTNKNFTV